jgi:hypothetical protein
MFYFNLPEYPNRLFSAHEESQLHDFRNDDVYTMLKMRQREYSDNIHKEVMKKHDIMPGDIVWMSPYWYPTREYYGLYMVILNKTGEKELESFGDGFSYVRAGSLYKKLLEHNPSFFDNVQDRIGSNTMIHEIKCIINSYEKYNSDTSAINEIDSDSSDDSSDDEEQVKPVRKGRKVQERYSRYHGIEVNKYKLDGTFIRKYKSLTAAVKSVNRTSGTDLHNAIKTADGIYRNYKWTLA